MTTTARRTRSTTARHCEPVSSPVPKILKDKAIGSISDGPITVTLKELCPDEARQLLTLNTRNRPILRSAVSVMVADMAKGNFVFNGDTIGISDEDVLINGQHRLEACVKSNKPLKVLLVTGLPHSVGTSIDQGRSRSVGDILRMTYNMTPPSTSKLAAAANILLGGASGVYPQRKPVVAEYLSRYADGLGTWVQWADTVARNCDKVIMTGHRNPQASMACAPLAAIAVYLCESRQVDVNLFREFINRAGSGIVAEEDTSGAIQAFRRYLRTDPLRTRNGNGGIRPMLDAYAVVITAFNKWCANEPVNRIVSPLRASARTFDDLPPVWLARTERLAS